MIKASRLKRLLQQIPDDADVFVIEDPEDEGILIERAEKRWYIRTSAHLVNLEDDYTEGFGEEYP